jgi:hypothetical protein
LNPPRGRLRIFFARSGLGWLPVAVRTSSALARRCLVPAPFHRSVPLILLGRPPDHRRQEAIARGGSQMHAHDHPPRRLLLRSRRPRDGELLQVAVDLALPLATRFEGEGDPTGGIRRRWLVADVAAASSSSSTPAWTSNTTTTTTQQQQHAPSKGGGYILAFVLLVVVASIVLGLLCCFCEGCGFRGWCTRRRRTRRQRRRRQQRRRQQQQQGGAGDATAAGTEDSSDNDTDDNDDDDDGDDDECCVLTIRGGRNRGGRSTHPSDVRYRQRQEMERRRRRGTPAQRRRKILQSFARCKVVMVSKP